MKIGIATDHNGVNEKHILIKYLMDLNCEVKDLSPNNYDTDDYPTFAANVAKSLQNHEIDLGILMCGTGIGMSIAANKFKNIRCAKVSNIDEARLSREHNNANVIALSYKMPMEELKSLINTFISTSFSSEERHIRRVNLIKEIEENEN